MNNPWFRRASRRHARGAVPLARVIGSDVVRIAIYDPDQDPERRDARQVVELAAAVIAALPA